MSAYTYAMDALLYLMTGMLDRGDEDIMVETAICKVFCSRYGWEVIDDAMQIMGGEGYMTEHELERIWRDNRIHRIVEGSNDVMQSFVFAYGGKQLAEQMISVQEALLWDSDESPEDNFSRILRAGTNPEVLKRAIPLGLQLFFGIKPARPNVEGLHPSLDAYAKRLSKLVQQHSHYFKLTSKWEREEIVRRQAQQARVADNAIMLFALACSLSKYDDQLRRGERGPAFERDRAALDYLFSLFEVRIQQGFGELKENADDAMRSAAEAALAHNDTLPNSDYYIHEASPEKSTGRDLPTEFIEQFPGEGLEEEQIGGDGAATGVEATVGTSSGAPEE